MGWKPFLEIEASVRGNPARAKLPLAGPRGTCVGFFFDLDSSSTVYNLYTTPTLPLPLAWSTWRKWCRRRSWWQLWLRRLLPRMPSNELHAAFRDGAEAEAEQLRLIAESPQFLEDEDDSWECWLPLHNASRWGASFDAVAAALAAYPEAAKIASKGGYEALHLCAMGGHVNAVSAIIDVYPEGALKKDNHGRTPLDEAREGSSPEHEAIVEKLLALPGVQEADAAEAELRAARAQELMRTDDDDWDEVNTNCARLKPAQQQLIRRWACLTPRVQNPSHAAMLPAPTALASPLL